MLPLELADGWSALLARQAGASVAQGPAYAAAALAAARPEGAQLALITAHHADGHLAGIWPLWTERDGGVRIARHIGGGSRQEYAGPLAESAEAVAAMLQVAKAEADALHLCNLPVGSPLLRLVRGLNTHRHAVNSPVTRCATAGTFDAWLAGRSKSFRQSIRAGRRRLADCGVLRMGRPRSEEFDRFVDWLFDAKCAWLGANHHHSDWLYVPGARAFAKAALRDPATGVVGHGIWIGDRQIAGSLSLVGPVCEYFVTTFDPAFARFSPGHILTAEVIAEAIGLGLDVDFRITNESYKERWIDDFDPRVTLTIATSWRAMPLLAREHLKSARRKAAQVRRQLRP